MREKIGIVLLIVCCIFVFDGCKGDTLIFENADSPLGTYEQNAKAEELQLEQQQILVHVCGAVNAPGVISLPEKTRVIDAIQMAGGLSPEADGAYLNLAAFVSDGATVYVPTVEEVLLWEAQQGQNVRVDINLADEAKLCTLPGIGESKAKDIIAYRDKNGDFQSIEDIMKVPGIKESLFQKIKDFIEVK